VPVPTEPPRALVERIERFLAARTRADDLGVRLDGAQLAAGVRFARMVREGQYDLVVGNPPYQGTARMADAAYVAKHYPKGKADLYAAFLQRGLELAKRGRHLSAMVTMRGWMFLGAVRGASGVAVQEDLRAVGDVESVRGRPRRATGDHDAYRSNH
jgi:methylase of polypeptide subunit release factors